MLSFAAFEVKGPAVAPGYPLWLLLEPRRREALHAADGHTETHQQGAPRLERQHVHPRGSLFYEERPAVSAGGERR